MKKNNLEMAISENSLYPYIDNFINSNPFILFNKAENNFIKNVMILTYSKFKQEQLELLIEEVNKILITLKKDIVFNNEITDVNNIIMDYIERMTLTEVAKERKSSFRSAKNWCNNNDIIIHKDGIPFIAKIDFEMAMDSPLIEDYINEYGEDNGLKLYKLYYENNIEELMKLKYSLKNMELNLAKRYKPKGDNAKNFLNK